ncbi:ribonuclease P protein component [Yeosuana marina]|uniref:ribonuclease P protein component n=1 Tax=Yeosuana marina TaxID=1565536 RepID=UPI00141DC8BC|nr:ribonuclease P protein component [Yeosuana marina]
MKLTFSKKEKLKSKILIEQLFTEGKSVSAYPLRLVYMPADLKDDALFKTGVSVSKRNFKRAVDRNRIKRLMRESFRLHKHDYINNMSVPYAFMILYIGKEKPSFDQVESKMTLLFEKFSNKVSPN